MEGTQEWREAMVMAAIFQTDFEKWLCARSIDLWVLSEDFMGPGRPWWARLVGKAIDLSGDSLDELELRLRRRRVAAGRALEARKQ